jgi:hypothetical protein
VSVPTTFPCKYASQALRMQWPRFWKWLFTKSSKCCSDQALNGQEVSKRYYSFLCGTTRQKKWLPYATVDWYSIILTREVELP